LRGNPIGTAAELLVCFDLERRGLDTFRAMSPGSRHDLIACDRRNGSENLWRLEVKNARKWRPLATGEERITFGGANINPTADVIALAVTAAPPEVFYFRPKSGSMYRIADQFRFWETT
jgi:hypothetical protein